MIIRKCRSLVPGLALVLWGLMPVQAEPSAPTHYTFTENTESNMTVLVASAVNPTVDGSPLSNGDEIGVFTAAGLCVGAIKWDGTGQTITVWGDDSETPNVDGMADNAKLNYRIWLSGPGREVLAFATYSPSFPDSLYYPNRISALASLAGISAPVAPTLASPTSQAVGLPLAMTLGWTSLATANSYSMQISTTSGFQTTIFSQGGLASNQASVSGLLNARTYYWRVNATNIGGTSAWSSTWSFSTIAHFTYLSETGDNMTVLIPAGVVPTLDGVPLANGDEIGIFTGSGRCVGGTVWDGQVQTISVWGENTDVDTSFHGMAEGGLLHWRIYSAPVNKEVLAFPTYTHGGFATSDSLYHSNGISILSALQGLTAITQTIPLGAGWNMKSFNVTPLDSNCSTIFPDPGWFMFVKGGSGEVYSPTMGGNFNYIKRGQGYQIYTQSASSLSTLGIPIDASATTIALRAGWNMIAYFPTSNMAPAAALQGIAGNLVLVKDNAGKVYTPGYGGNMTTMTAGEGYQICVSGACTLTYPSGSEKTVAAKPVLSLPAPQHFAGHAITGSNATIIAQQVVLNGATAHDSCEIGAYDDQGNLVGAGTVMHGVSAFTVWGDDPYTTGKDGLAAGDAIHLMLWDGMKEYPLHFSGAAEPSYQKDALLQGSFSTAREIAATQFNMAKVFPNPFRGCTRIAFDVPSIAGSRSNHVEVAVYDIKGNLVRTLAKGDYAPGSYSVEWSGAGERGAPALGSTLYIVRMKAQNFEKKIKLIKLH